MVRRLWIHKKAIESDIYSMRCTCNAIQHVVSCSSWTTGSGTAMSPDSSQCYFSPVSINSGKAEGSPSSLVRARRTAASKHALGYVDLEDHTMFSTAPLGASQSPMNKTCPNTCASTLCVLHCCEFENWSGATESLEVEEPSTGRNSARTVCTRV